MKRILVCTLTILIVIFSVTTSFAAVASTAANATFDEIGSEDYSIVSAVVNRSYDFKDDFHDSYPYDEDFYTEGIFRMDDAEPDVTLTLKDNTTGEEIVYEKNDETEWYVRASVDHLLYENTQIDGVLQIVDLGGEYGIKDTDVPVTVNVISSLYSADYHKYPSYIANTSMTEGECYTIEYDPSSSDGKATITVLKIPHIFTLSLYNVETRQIDCYDDTNGVFKYQKEIEVADFDPSCRRFWFFVPMTLVMDDGYEYNFILSVDALRKKSTDDSVEPAAPSDEPSAAPGVVPGSSTNGGAKKDSAPASGDSVKPASNDNGVVQTGDSIAAYILSLTALAAAAGLMLYGRKRKIKE